MPPRKKQIIEPILEPAIDPALEAEDAQEETITFKLSHFYAALSVLAFATGLLFGYIIWGTRSAGISGRTANQQTGLGAEGSALQTSQYTRFDIPTQNSYAIGPTDAPITIVEFSDYECPYCRRWHAEVYKPLLAAYPGKIRMVYRNLPLTSIHPDALAAAEAAMCAGEQDVYWKYHDKLFSSESLGNDVYLQYAEDLGLNMPVFKACMNNHKYQKAIKTDSDFAINLGVNSTPTFFVNGIPIVGAQPLGVFKQVIDKELAGGNPK